MVVRTFYYLFVTLSLLPCFLAPVNSICPTGTGNLSPEKRVIRSSIAVKALVTNIHEPNEEEQHSKQKTIEKFYVSPFSRPWRTHQKSLPASTVKKNSDKGVKIVELWLLDVYKGADKLAASLGINIHGSSQTTGVSPFNSLRDR